jgi:myo-inositol-1-phosphate synthase
MSTVRVVIVGVGNYACALVQGVHGGGHAADDELVRGLMHINPGGYHVRDIEFAAACDVDATKVGQDLSVAIFAPPNNTMRFAEVEVPPLGVPVQWGMARDGVGKYLSQVITKRPGPSTNIVSGLQETGTDVVVNYLPVGACA